MTGESGLIVASTYGERGASTRVRLYDWLDHLDLDAERHEYVSTSDNSLSTLARRAPQVVWGEVDLRRLRSRLSDRTLVVSRQVSPFSSGRVEQSLLRQAKHSIYDFDDAIWADTAHWSRALWSKRSVWEKSVAAADVVIAGSTYLAEAASRRSNNVVMIPSCVEPNRYLRKTNYELAGPPVAVWIGSAATEPFLGELSGPLEDLNRQYGLRVKVISGSGSHLGAMESLVDRVPWSLDTFGADLAGADFGLMPLPDTEYTRGKCSYKLLQYGAAGLPLIGTPVGANATVLESMGGFAAINAADWFEAISSIVDSTSQIRREMGNRMHATVVSKFSFDAWETQWRDAVGISPKPTMTDGI